VSNPRPLQIECDRCIRGFVHNGSEWPTRCLFCSGRGSMSLDHICFAIRENVSTVRKLLRPNKRMRAKVAYRIFLNLDRWLHPKQPEMFR
jgi:hypothetical protein